MNEEDDLYESLPPSSTITTHMCAGALAGVGEHCVMYPFDCVKVKMYSSSYEIIYVIGARGQTRMFIP